MNERMENYLLDQIERLTNELASSKSAIDYYVTSLGEERAKVTSLESIAIDVGAVITQQATDNAKKDEIISMWENMYKIQTEVLDKTEAELLEAQSRGN